MFAHSAHAHAHPRTKALHIPQGASSGGVANLEAVRSGHHSLSTAGALVARNTRAVLSMRRGFAVVLVLLGRTTLVAAPAYALMVRAQSGKGNLLGGLALAAVLFGMAVLCSVLPFSPLDLVGIQEGALVGETVLGTRRLPLTDLQARRVAVLARGGDLLELRSRNKRIVVSTHVRADDTLAAAIGRVERAGAVTRGLRYFAVEFLLLVCGIAVIALLGGAL